MRKKRKKTVRTPAKRPKYFFFNDLLKDFDKLPGEVQDAVCFIELTKTGKLTLDGRELKVRTLGIIDKYPEYFPLYHTMNNVPEEVMLQYYQDLELYEPKYKVPANPCQGEVGKLTQKDIDTWVNWIQDARNKEYENDIHYEKFIRTLQLKHFLKYCI